MFPASAESDISERCQCGVCLSRFDSSVHRPRILKCGHTWCEDCLIAIFRETTYWTCPNCRTNQLGSNISELPVNYAIIGISDAVHDLTVAPAVQAENTKKQRCRFAFFCQNRATCKYMHPSTKCKFYDNDSQCPYGGACLHFHNTCKQTQCVDVFCTSEHLEKRVVEPRWCSEGTLCNKKQDCEKKGFIHPRLRAPDQKKQLKKRCVDFPSCNKGTKCPDIHPIEPCKMYENARQCPKGGACTYLHPICLAPNCADAYCVMQHNKVRPIKVEWCLFGKECYQKRECTAKGRTHPR